ncbi:hypothetical protein [Marinobacter sp. SS8-8]|uniref:hypothetical protein n=1 Tax=Marinobacter sp. SS8-8 TaxID=3050452 RepID=UPI0026E08519|nr:hypothetical protein [Marinobacter sp. SS8-8]
MLKMKIIGVEDVVEDCLEIGESFTKKIGLESPLEIGYLGQQRAFYLNDEKAAEFFEVKTKDWSMDDIKNYLKTIVQDLRREYPKLMGKDWKKRIFIGFDKKQCEYGILIPFVVEDEILVDTWGIRAEEVAEKLNSKRFSDDDFPELAQEAKAFVFDVNSGRVVDEMDFSTAEGLLKQGWSPKKPETFSDGSALLGKKNTRRRLRR